MPDTLWLQGAVQTERKAVRSGSRTVVRVNVRKIVGLLALALLIFFVVTRPDAAANSLQNIGGILSDIANSVADFFTALV